jgi:hypothetical protein
MKGTEYHYEWKPVAGGYTEDGDGKSLGKGMLLGGVIAGQDGDNVIA